MKCFNQVGIGKHLSETCPIKNGLQQDDVLSPLIFNLALKYAIRKVQENKDEQELNGIHELLVCADDIYWVKT
jgi:hypothetical protein